jgi:hypothetical protein
MHAIHMETCTFYCTRLILPITTYGAVPSVGSADPKPKAVPFKVASSIVPIPAKLVKRIQALEFVDTRELLPDNIALAGSPSSRPLQLMSPSWLRHTPSVWETCWHTCASSPVRPANSGAPAG